MSGAIGGGVLLLAAVTALGAAGLRVASLASPRGLERALAAASLAVATAVVEALALGAVGLGGSALALTAAALVTWLAARRWTPPAPPLRADLTAWLGQARPTARFAAALLGGLWIGWAVWALRFPHLGLDGSTYHLAAVADWVMDGSTGHAQDLYARIPVGSYPRTSEAALAWAVGLAHSFAPVGLWSASMAALAAAASWVGLRALRVPPLLAAPAILALCLVPIALRGLVHFETDMPAVTWLITAAALVACARERPALLAPALVAAALAVGTKTTALPLAAVVVGLGFAGVRGSLRRLAVPLALAAALGLAAGGVWYLRNLLAHGSPLWPFVAAPWGDPVPPLFERVNYSLLERPRATLEGQWPIYRVTLSGGLVLLAGGLLAPLWARRRAAAGAALATLAALLAWASAPFTGAGAAPFLQVNTLRYLIPALAAGTLSLALSGRAGRGARAWVALLLAVAVGWSAKAYLDDPYLPAEGTFVLATVAGAIVAACAGAAMLRLGDRGRTLRATAAAAALALAVLLAVAGRHYVERYAVARDFNSSVVQWFAGRPRWRDGDRPIAFSPTPIAPAAGDELRHPLELVPPDEPCGRVLARASRGWVVVRDLDRKLFGAVAAERCLARAKPVFDDGINRVYAAPSAQRVP